MTNRRITITSADGLSFGAYVAQPSVVPAPAVIVIQEIFGVNPWLRSIADWLAGAGFLAVAPDLFFRLEPGIELTDKTEAEWEKAFALYKAFDENQGVKDITAVLQALKHMPECNGSVGTLGFCLGGKLAFLMSTRGDSDCNVGYYGVGIEQNLAEPVRHPLMLHIAEKDAHVPASAQDAIKKALGHDHLVNIHVYPGCDHAFGRPGSAHYDEKAMDLACSRSLEFLKIHLGTAALAGRP